MELTRRDFMKRLAVTGGALGAAGLIGCAADASTTNEAQGQVTNQKWDKEADFVVIGGGTGQAGAVFAANAGMSVILLEKRDMLGGAMAFSGGQIWLANTEYSKQFGDSYEKAKTYLDHMQMGYGANEIVEAYLNNTQAVIDGLRSAGLDIQPRETGSDYQVWEGSMSGRTCQLGEVVQGSMSAKGILLGATLSETCENLGVEILTGTAGDRLATYRPDPDAVPEVVGVIAIDEDGKELRIKANKGVLLATGGFEWNEEYCKNYLRLPLKYGKTWPSNVGDGLRMALSVGADLRLMNFAFGQLVFTAEGEYAKERGEIYAMGGNLARGNSGSIVVDQTGRRFCCEDNSYTAVTNTFGGYLNYGDQGYSCDPAWWICDQASYDENDGPYGTVKRAGFPYPDETELPEESYLIKADSILELGEKIGINAEQLVKTIDEYNGYAIEGRDPLFRRGEEPKNSSGALSVLKPISTPPYYAASVSVGAQGTMGGPRLNGNAQVIHISGEPVKGLYAMGNCAGIGGPGPCYGGDGGTIGPAFTFGVIAARHAANREV
jgi:succinate dehydrogenase/fumarate reductase flavoprotein subunit